MPQATLNAQATLNTIFIQGPVIQVSSTTVNESKLSFGIKV